MSSRRLCQRRFAVDVTFLALLGGRLEVGLAVVAICTGLLLGMNGAGRALAIRMSDRAGRRRTLGRVLALLGIGQVCFAGAATSGAVPLLVVSALIAGVLALGSAALCFRLRQPGRIPILPDTAPRPHLTG